MKYPVKYEVEICSEFKDFKVEKIKGVTFGENFTDAMYNIEEYYGKELLTVKLEMLEEASVYEFTEGD